MVSVDCWVCGSRMRLKLQDDRLEVRGCPSCGHLIAKHLTPFDSAGVDYHRAYDQSGFLDSLAATRTRQARELVGQLQALGVTGRVLDYGSGRGFFLRAARELGLAPLAGADTSALAVDWLQREQLAAIALDPKASALQRLDAGVLPFAPEAVSFLDVIEHFEGDLVALFEPWLRALSPQTRLLVFKVPTCEGLLFRAARALHLAGARDPLHQLFQVGTHPPHFQYFSKRSLQAFCERVGLSVAAGWDDPEFEPETFNQRVTALRSLPAAPVRLGAGLLARAGRAAGWCDTRVVIAQRQP